MLKVKKQIVGSETHGDILKIMSKVFSTFLITTILYFF